jgi:hypothetical protein
LLRYVLRFVTAQHTGGPADRLRAVDAGVVGLSARTVRRRPSSVSGLFALSRARVTCRPTRSPVGCRPGENGSVRVRVCRWYVLRERCRAACRCRRRRSLGAARVRGFSA